VGEWAAQGSFINLSNGILSFYQGGDMKAQIKLAAVAGILSLVASGLPISCEGINSTGDINGETVDTSAAWIAMNDPKFGTESIFAIAYGGGRFIAGGGSGKMAYWNATITARLIFNDNGTVGWVKA
jgi:hypothetical protein